MSCQNLLPLHSVCLPKWQRKMQTQVLDLTMEAWWKLFRVVWNKISQFKEKQRQEINKIFLDLELMIKQIWELINHQITRQLLTWAKDSPTNMIRIQDQVVMMLKRIKVVLCTQWLHQEEIAWVIKVKLQAQEHIMILIRQLLEAELQMSSSHRAKKISMLRWPRMLQDLVNTSKK